MKSVAGLIAVLGAAALPFTPAIAQEAIANLTPVTDAMLANPAPADWPMWRRTLNNWGYSPLDGIDTRNVATLKMVWTRPLGEGAYQEGTPLVHDGIMYFPNPNDFTQALNAATGEFIWEHRRKVP